MKKINIDWLSFLNLLLAVFLIGCIFAPKTSAKDKEDDDAVPLPSTVDCKEDGRYMVWTKKGSQWFWVFPLPNKKEGLLEKGL